MFALSWRTGGVVNPDRGYVEDSDREFLERMAEKLNEFGYLTKLETL